MTIDQLLAGLGLRRAVQVTSPQRLGHVCPRLRRLCRWPRAAPVDVGPAEAAKQPAVAASTKRPAQESPLWHVPWRRVAPERSLVAWIAGGQCRADGGVGRCDDRLKVLGRWFPAEPRTVM